MLKIIDLVRHIFFIRLLNINEENLARFTAVRFRTLNRLKDIYRSPYLIAIPERKEVSLSECIEDAVSSLKDMAEGKKINLLWSGGIDSTLVFCALVKAGIKFTVLMDENSHKEYPFLFDKIINKEYNCDYRMFSPKGLSDLLDMVEEGDNIFVTGEIGDQVTGSMINMRYTYEERNMMMKEVIEKDLFCQPYTIETVTHVYDPIPVDGINGTQAAIAHCKDTVYEFLGSNEDNTTLAEFLWGLNFIFKYTTVLLRLHRVGLYYDGEDKNTFHFFNTEKFQQWAMANYKENCAYVRDTDYKMPFKDYIFEFTGDADYRDCKLKEPSLRVCFYYDEQKSPRI